MCSSAAEKGHFEILKWARENDCPCRRQGQASLREDCQAKAGKRDCRNKRYNIYKKSKLLDITLDGIDLCDQKPFLLKNGQNLNDCDSILKTL
jgi:hypothetical protein